MSPHPYVALAIDAVRYYLENEEPLPCPKNLPEDLKQKTGTFVSIKKGTALRGCIGTVTPVEPNLAQEIIRNAVSAAAQDPRFSPVSKAELASLTFSVDVLTPPEKVDGVSDLDTKRYGIILRGKDKQAVLLPDLEGIDTVEEQMKICRKKAGLKKNESIKLFRFQVKRYS